MRSLYWLSAGPILDDWHSEGVVGWSARFDLRWGRMIFECKQATVLYKITADTIFSNSESTVKVDFIPVLVLDTLHHQVRFQGQVRHPNAISSPIW